MSHPPRTIVALWLTALLWDPTCRAAPPRSDCVAIRSGRVWTGHTMLDAATVVLRGHRVVSVSAAEPPPPECKLIDEAGTIVTPGFIDAGTQVGLVDVSLEPTANDAASKPPGPRTPPSPVHASYRAADAYNPLSPVVAVTRSGGITAVLTVPRGGVVTGQAAWAELAGTTQAEAIRRPFAALAALVVGGDMPRAWAYETLRLWLEEAAAFGTHREAWSRRQYRPWRFPFTELRAAQPVLRGDVPLAVYVDRAAEIEAVVRLAQRMGIRLVVAGGAEAWIVRDLLARAHVPVVVDPMLEGPENFDKLHARPDNAALLHEAGVPVIISSFATHHARKLRQAAGNAVRQGLPWDAALAAVTSEPATAFGVRDEGVLEPGARANVVVWSGDPLELDTEVLHVFIGGREMSLDNRQRALERRYLHLPGRPKPLPLP